MNAYFEDTAEKENTLIQSALSILNDVQEAIIDDVLHSIQAPLDMEHIFNDDLSSEPWNNTGVA